MIKAYILYGLGAGCHQEVAHAYERAGAVAEMVHINQLLTGDKALDNAQILNMTGGFLHGDALGAGMCAANTFKHEHQGNPAFKDALMAFAEKDRIIYGQCNGFQTLVKMGLLPAIGDDASTQQVTLTSNDCGEFRVDYVHHRAQGDHFAFEGLEDFYLWCRHGEGKLQFSTQYGLLDAKEGERNRKAVNANHVILRYWDSATDAPAVDFPASPNGSIDGIAGLANLKQNVFAQMGHPEVEVYGSTDPRYFQKKDRLRRNGMDPDTIEAVLNDTSGLKIFQNIVRMMK